MVPNPIPKAPARRRTRPPRQHLASLHEAARDGHDEVLLRYLRADPAAVHARDDAGWTPLMHAAYHGHPAAVRILLAAGADPEAYDLDGCGSAFLNCNGRPDGPGRNDAQIEIGRLLLERPTPPPPHMYSAADEP
jgi:hypothetical protein